MPKKITAEELKEKLNKEEICLVDVRELSENQAERIEKAQLIPLAELSVEKLPTTTKPIVLHCRFGKRSCDACEILLKENPNLDVSFLEGGIVAWKNAGGAVIKGPISIPRQVQMATGILIIISMLLGATGAHIFYLIPIVIGAALLYVGLTGWNRIDVVMSKMPWNQK